MGLVSSNTSPRLALWSQEIVGNGTNAVLMEQWSTDQSRLSLQAACTHSSADHLHCSSWQGRETLERHCWRTCQYQCKQTLGLSQKYTTGHQCTESISRLWHEDIQCLQRTSRRPGSYENPNRGNDTSALGTDLCSCWKDGALKSRLADVCTSQPSRCCCEHKA